MIFLCKLILTQCEQNEKFIFCVTVFLQSFRQIKALICFSKMMSQHWKLKRIYQVLDLNINQIKLSFFNLVQQNYLITEGMDFDQYEQFILKTIAEYQKSEGKSMNLYKKSKKQLDMYEIHLLDSMAAESRHNFLQTQKQNLQKIKQQKMLIKDELKVKNILAVGQDINNRMDDILKDTEEAIQVSTYIRVELDRQIQALDLLQTQNKEFKKRIKKAKQGLKVIIKRAMLNKITRFLMVLVLLAVIGLVTVSILKDKGIIQV